MSLVDTHCHLDFNTFEADRQEVLDRARLAGVNGVINPGIDLITSQAAIELAHRYPSVYAGVGVHPNDGAGWNDDTLARLRELARDQRVVAIGEIGLDYYRDRVDHAVQKQLLRAQLKLAAELSLPVIIHNRNSTDDLLAILTDWTADLMKINPSLAQRPGVMHSFEGDFAAAGNFINLNFVIGVGGPVTYKNALERQTLIKALPIERIVIETDAPFLAPLPFRGHRNEPGYVRMVAEKIAALKEMPFQKVAEITTANASYLYGQEF